MRRVCPEGHVDSTRLRGLLRSHFENVGLELIVIDGERRWWIYYCDGGRGGRGRNLEATREQRETPIEGLVFRVHVLGRLHTDNSLRSSERDGV